MQHKEKNCKHLYDFKKNNSGVKFVIIKIENRTLFPSSSVTCFLTCQFSSTQSPNFKQNSLDFTCKEKEKTVAINMKLLNFVIKTIVICTCEAWETVQEICVYQ